MKTSPLTVTITIEDPSGLQVECDHHNHGNRLYHKPITVAEYVDMAVQNLARSANHEYTRDPELLARHDAIMAARAQADNADKLRIEAEERHRAELESRDAQLAGLQDQLVRAQKRRPLDPPETAAAPA